MACRLFGTKPSTQCWAVITWTLSNQLHWNLNLSTTIFIQVNALKSRQQKGDLLVHAHIYWILKPLTLHESIFVSSNCNDSAMVTTAVRLTDMLTTLPHALLKNCSPRGHYGSERSLALVRPRLQQQRRRFQGKLVFTELQRNTPADVYATKTCSYPYTNHLSTTTTHLFVPGNCFYLKNVWMLIDWPPVWLLRIELINPYELH